MIPLPTRKGSLWGTEYDVVPYLIEAIHGDGKRWIWYEYLEDRPNFYVVRVDSSCNLGTDDVDNDDDYAVVDWIDEQIRDEGMCFLSEEQYEEYSENGYIEDGADFPVPPLEMPCGSAWGKYTPDEEDLVAAGSPREVPR